MATKPTHVRIKALGKVLDTIQNTMELMGGKERDGARVALNAVRKEYGLPIDGEQMTIADFTEKGKK